MLKLTIPPENAARVYPSRTKRYYDTHDISKDIVGSGVFKVLTLSNTVGGCGVFRAILCTDIDGEEVLLAPGSESSGLNALQDTFMSLLDVLSAMANRVMVNGKNVEKLNKTEKGWIEMGW